MPEGDGNSGLWTTIVATGGTVAIALIGAVTTFLIRDNAKPIPEKLPIVAYEPPNVIAQVDGSLTEPNAIVWLVQLGYFDSRANAEQRVLLLKQQGFVGLRVVNANEFPGLKKKNGHFLVVGPANEAEVTALLDKAKKYVADAFVVNGYVQKASNK